MKKLILTLFAVFMAVSAFSQAQGTATAPVQPGQPGQPVQQDPMMQSVPNDPAVRIGVMPNGIKYYIRHNDRDPQRANFHIYYKVGAIQEQDHQNGLAHFLEHMAFNGSKNFPDNSLSSYLESIGVRFGENLNAETGQESTSYMVTNVPVIREGILDSALLILHDWAGFISLNHDDIDAERGVIREELRSGRNSQRRVMEAQFPVIFNNSIYAKRNVIGNDSLLSSFKYQDIKDFYHKWYRPDMQAFVIVGDIDVDQVERKLLAVMADIPAPSAELAAFVKEMPVIEDNEKPLISITSDPEFKGAQVQMIFRHQPMPFDMKDKLAAQYMDIVNTLIGRMFNERLMEISQKPDAPFMGAGGDYISLVQAIDAFYLGASARDNESLRAVEALYTEVLRMQRGGFTQSELDRAKASLMQNISMTYDNRDNRRNMEFVQEYMSNFSSNTPYATPEIKKAIAEQLLQWINIEAVNQVAASYVRDKNSAFLVVTPKAEGVVVPTETQILDVIAKVKGSDIKAYTENVITKPLVSATLKGAKVVRTAAGELGTTVWTLKNGVKVVLKPTKFEGGRVSMEAFQKGGTSKISDLAQLYSINLLGEFSGMAGVGEFSAIDLNRMMAGKKANVVNSVSELSQGFAGDCSTKDFETMMQLTYLRYTQPRFDKTDWDVFVSQYTSMLPSLKNNPDYIYSDSTINTVYAHNPRMSIISEGTMSMVSLDNLAAAYKTLYSNANGMTFVFVGDFDAEAIRPMVEMYLGSLPTGKVTAAWGTNVNEIAKGKIENRFSFPLETPKVDATQINSGTFDYTLENRLAANAISYILDMRYIKSIREEKGGTYGVQVRMSFDKFPKPVFVLNIAFKTDASKIDELMPIIAKEIQDVVSDGVSEENLRKFKEFNVKKFAENETSNSSWMYYVKNFYQNGDNFYDGYVERINGLTSDKIRDLAGKMFDQGNVVKVIMTPQSK